MTALVVRMMTDIASGATATTGAELARTVSDLVRERLGRDPGGRAALAAVDAGPSDPEAPALLAEALSAAVAEDPDFAALLVRALTGPPPARPPRSNVGGIVIDGGARVRRSTIALGPVTFNNTPAGRALAVLVTVALVVLVALGVYGGTRLLDGDDSPGSGAARPGGSDGVWGAPDGGSGDGGGGGSGGGSGGGKARELTDAAAVKAVLPDAASLPSGWTEVTAPTADVSSQDDGSTFEGQAEYRARFSMETELVVYAYPGTAEARTAFEKYRRKAQEAGAAKLTMPRIGDESTAFTRSSSRGAGYVTETVHYTMVRTGTLLTVVFGKDNESRSYDSGDLESLTRLLSERARAAQNG
ncbi:hypothetical protein [Streptomyces sp. NPDC089799]|uniref:hypothetical protein n=1 Tax=Streptomyces sp. NPDC089799 TaxID=3155066 RepID=UPI00342086F3